MLTIQIEPSTADLVTFGIWVFIMLLGNVFLGRGWYR